MFDVFKNPDVIEEKIGKRVEQFDPKNLFDYVWEMHKAVLGYKYPADYHKDNAIYKRAMSHYGEDMGKMVKYIFLVKHGKWNGQNFSATWWTINCRWISDQIYASMKEYEKKCAQRSKPVVGFKSLGSLTKVG